MSTIELIKLIDLAWEEGFSIANIKPCIDKGYIHFRNSVFNELNKSLYQKFFMTVEELQACREGYIYIHDMSARRDTMNCCLFDVKSVLTGGFEM